MLYVVSHLFQFPAQRDLAVSKTAADVVPHLDVLHAEGHQAVAI